MLVGAVLVSVFWDSHNILLIDALRNKVINSEYYMTLLVYLIKGIAKNDFKFRRKKCSFTKTLNHVTSRS